jgi:hypothetical protein
MLGLPDDTALRTPASRLARPCCSLRMTRLIGRVTNSGAPPQFCIMVGQ